MTLETITDKEIKYYTLMALMKIEAHLGELVSNQATVDYSDLDITEVITNDTSRVNQSN